MLVSIYDHFKVLLSRVAFGASDLDKKSKNEKEKKHFLDCTLVQNIEGADPANFCNFESVHPLPGGDY